jgi:predicted naringenin-chalcone synthase
MKLFAEQAPKLAIPAVEALSPGAVTHLIVTCCTGFSAPGLDLQLVDYLGLSPSVERTTIGFMGCYAAINGLKLARHIVRSEPASRVLMINLELCTLHFKESTDLEQILAFFLFADGCAASLISAEPEGLAIDGFYSARLPDTACLIQWNIGDSGFDMHLSGHVPGAIRELLPSEAERMVGGPTDLWAIHPGGRSILDAVQHAVQIPADGLKASREVLREFGNMSSATVMFVLKRLMEGAHPGETGCAMSFGPGIMAETMRFHVPGGPG